VSAVIGHVSLIGAGPGDPDLLTMRAVRRLREADLVLYDALVAPEARAFAPEARWFCVGKRAASASSPLAGTAATPQPAINRMLIRQARRGQCVVRLKGGDPFVFGRGGEEGIALCEAGIPFEVIPGVSSALAAPALAGIPLTHRGLSSAFSVIAGHAPETYGPIVDALPPGVSTLVVMMGLGNRTTIAARLLARGWSVQTPVAILLRAATSQPARWLGTLGALGAETPSPALVGPPTSVASPEDEGGPGLIVIGDVVSLASVLQPATLPAAAIALPWAAKK
jgi:uroporphyrin-III C-methyltransferase/precorrin-2 dehydrogenase/sirohydrochlorin ferrochelatase